MPAASLADATSSPIEKGETMTAEPLTKRKVQVLGRAMAYHESGEGAPILFLHGIPTSSYLWRNVIPELKGLGRLIVPDLTGMGDSEKLPNPGAETYRFVTHSEYLWAFIGSVIGPDEPLLLVAHDWGSALALQLGISASQPHSRHCLHGGACPPFCRLARMDRGAVAFPGLPVGRRRIDDSRPQHLRREDPTGIKYSQAERGRNGGIPPALPPAGGSLADSYLATADSHWRRAR